MHICFICHLPVSFCFSLSAKRRGIAGRESNENWQEIKGETLKYTRPTAHANTQTMVRYLNTCGVLRIRSYISLFRLPLYTYRRCTAFACLLTHISSLLWHRKTSSQFRIAPTNMFTIKCFLVGA